MKILSIIGLGILFPLNIYAQDKTTISIPQQNPDMVCKRVAFSKEKCKPEGRYSSDRNIYPIQDISADHYNLNLNENNKVDKAPNRNDKELMQQRQPLPR